MPKFKNREYQDNMIEQVRNLMRQGIKRIVVQAPTGSGKTVLCTSMISAAEAKGLRTWFIVHRRELIKQSMKAYERNGLNYAVISAGFPQEDAYLTQICSIGTLIRRLEKVKEPVLLVHDEGHHVPAKSWQKVIDRYPNAFHVALTATPCRLDGKGLDDFFDDMVLGPKVQWLINEGYLANYKYFAPSTLDVSGIRKRMGDYVKSEVADAVDNNAVIGDAAEQYLKRAAGKRCITFCITVAHSKHVVEMYREKGISAHHVDGETPTAERDWAIEEFAKGNITVLSNVGLFGEGFDVPSVEAVQMLRPTTSLALYLQMVGRALRPVYCEGMPLETREQRLQAIERGPKGDAIILDHCSNYDRHGLPDEDRDWSLAGAPVREKGEVSVKQCDRCYNVQPVGKKKCDSCGYVFSSAGGGGREINEVEGDLQEIKRREVEEQRRAAIQRKREQGRAETVEELTELGRRRGMKNPAGWAKHVFNARQAKRNRGY